MSVIATSNIDVCEHDRGSIRPHIGDTAQMVLAQILKDYSIEGPEFDVSLRNSQDGRRLFLVASKHKEDFG